MSQERGQLWRAVDALIDRSPGFEDLYAHRLHLLAAQRWRGSDLPVPDELVKEERREAMTSLAYPAVLEQVLQIADGPVVVFKGPEAAARYPDPALRPFADVDLFVRDPRTVQRALLAQGFIEVGDPRLVIIHHLQPLRSPSLPIVLELHAIPKWLDGLRPPRREELLDAAVPALCGPPGISALSPAHHVVVMAVHSWAHGPLRRLLDLVDIAAISPEADATEIRRVARNWGVEPVWNATATAVDALFYGGDVPLSLRTWGRNAVGARDRTVLENHFERWLSPFWTFLPAVAVRRAALAVRSDLQPKPGETWAEKLNRTRRAVANATERLSMHDRAAGTRGTEASDHDSRKQASGE